MSIFDFFRKRFFEEDLKLETAEKTIEQLEIEFFAINCGISLIANAVAAAEFSMFLNGEKKRDAEYYLWNVQPNCKENKNQFITKVVERLLIDGDVLIIEKNKQLFVADSFSRTPHGTRPDEYSNIQIEDENLSSIKTEDTLYLKLANPDLSLYLKSVAGRYSNLLSFSAEKLRKSASQKGVITVESTIGGKSEEDMQKANQALSKSIHDFLRDNDGVLPLRKGMQYTEIGGKTSKTDNNATEVEGLTKQVFSKVAEAFHIPVGLLMGNIAEVKDLRDDFLTFAVKGNVTDQLESEINAKRWGEEAFVEKTFCKIDLSKIEYRSLINNSKEVFNLIGSTYSREEIDEMFGRVPPKEPFVKERFMTLNNSSIKRIINTNQEE